MKTKHSFLDTSVVILFVWHGKYWNHPRPITKIPAAQTNMQASHSLSLDKRLSSMHAMVPHSCVLQGMTTLLYIETSFPGSFLMPTHGVGMSTRTWGASIDLTRCTELVASMIFGLYREYQRFNLLNQISKPTNLGISKCNHVSFKALLKLISYFSTTCNSSIPRVLLYEKKLHIAWCK